MKRVLTAIILIPIVLLIVFRAPLWLFAIVVGIIALITVHEYLGLVEAHAIRPARTLTYIFMVILFASWMATLAVETRLSSLPSQTLLRGTAWLEHPYLAFMMGASSAGMYSVLLAAMFFLVVLMARDDLRSALPAAGASALGLVYVGFPLASLISIRSHSAGALLVFYVLVVVWAGDIVAFVVGRYWGRHKLAPRISPHKTWEGAVASFIAATALGTLILSAGNSIIDFLQNERLLAAVQGNILSTVLKPGARPLWVCIALSAALNVAAQLGDLAESMIKRGAGVKDSGALLPGHGGLLDRIDALLFAAPVLWYYAQVLTAVRIP